MCFLFEKAYWQKGFVYWERQLENIKSSKVEGIERVVAIGLWHLYLYSLLFWITVRLATGLEGRQRSAERIVEWYAPARLGLSIVFTILFPPILLWVVFPFLVYLLLELYVALLLIVFVSKYNISAVPGFHPRRSIERLLILIILNVSEVTVVFALFYRLFLKQDPGGFVAIAYAIEVFGTVGTPPVSPTDGGLFTVAFHLVADFVLLAILLTMLVGRLSGSVAEDGPETNPAKAPSSASLPLPPSPP
jgi:hypothetical protein